MKMTRQEIGYLRIIADEVDNYLKNRTATRPERSNIAKTMDSVLPRMMPMYKFKTDWYYSKTPFIACIRPDIDELTKKSEGLINVLNDPKADNQDYIQKWCEIHNWEIQLDPRILTKGDPSCVDNGNQFVAILCHEIGHVMNRDPYAFIKNYRDVMMKSDKLERMIFSKNPVIRKCILPMFVCTQAFSVIVVNKDNEQIEMAADAYVPPEFAPDLVAYIEGHLLPNPDTNRMVMAKTEYDGNQKTAVEYSRSTIDLMQKRRDVLKQYIGAQHNSPDADNYMKRLMVVIGKAVGHYDPNTDTTSILSELTDVEYFNRNMQAITEEYNAIMESTKVTDRELTILEIEASDIKTAEDKLYIIQTIYDYLEAVTKQQSDRYKKVNKGQKFTEAELKDIVASDNRVARLNALRTKVMAIKPEETEDHYGLFIKYPKGYEG